MLTIPELQEKYNEAVTNGEDIQELATRLGMKLPSLNQRLTLLRGDLRDGGATDEEIKQLLPPLKRRTGKRTSGRKAMLAKMLAGVRKPADPDPAIAISAAIAADAQASPFIGDLS